MKNEEKLMAWSSGQVFCLKKSDLMYLLCRYLPEDLALRCKPSVRWPYRSLLRLLRYVMPDSLAQSAFYIWPKSMEN